jgi:hypothetical protein
MPKPVYRTPLEAIVREEASAMGRPCKFDPETERTLIRAIEDGLTLKVAASLAGICYETLNRWKKRGEGSYAEPKFRQFCHALEKANARAVQKHVQNISNHARKDWKASAWILERRFREIFGKDSVEDKAHFWDEEGPEQYEVLKRMKQQRMNEEFLAEIGDMLTDRKILREQGLLPPEDEKSE